MALIEKKPERTKDVVLASIAANPGITEKQLSELTEFSSSKLTPSRIRLWEAGAIEPTSESGWKRALVSRVKGVGWHLVEPERRQTVAARAKSREKRNAKSVEARAARIVEDLRDPTVHRLVTRMLDEKGISGRHLRRNEEALRKQETLRKQEAKRAEREKTANADMKKKLALLWDARSTVAAIDDHLIEERARVARGEPRRIGDADWLFALRDVLMILHSLGSIWSNIRDLGDDMPCPVCGSPQTSEHRHLRAFAIDVDAEEEDDLMDAEEVVSG